MSIVKLTTERIILWKILADFSLYFPSAVWLDVDLDDIWTSRCWPSPCRSDIEIDCRIDIGINDYADFDHCVRTGCRSQCPSDDHADGESYGVSDALPHDQQDLHSDIQVDIQHDVYPMIEHGVDALACTHDGGYGDAYVQAALGHHITCNSLHRCPSDFRLAVDLAVAGDADAGTARDGGADGVRDRPLIVRLGILLAITPSPQRISAQIVHRIEGYMTNNKIINGDIDNTVTMTIHATPTGASPPWQNTASNSSSS